MRTFLGYAAVAIAALLLTSCDSEQPANGGTADAILAIKTSEATIPLGDMWEIWEDTTVPPDGIPDRQKRQFQPNGPLLYRCQPTGNSATSIYPWGFTVEVSVIRAGTATPVVLSTTGLEDQRYSAVTLAPTEETPLPDADHPGSNEYDRNGKEVSIAHPDFATFCLDQFVDPNIGPGLDNPASIALNKGDTLLVQARKAPANDNPVLGGLFPNPVMSGVVTIGGIPVILAGQSQSTADDGAGISFSFTLH